jgi:hypothetical protein
MSHGRNAMDWQTAFMCLLDLDPTFGYLRILDGLKVVDRFLRAWHGADGALDMHIFCKEWLVKRDERRTTWGAWAATRRPFETTESVDGGEF